MNLDEAHDGKTTPSGKKPSNRKRGESSREERLLRRKDVLAYEVDGAEYGYRPGRLLSALEDFDVVNDAVQAKGGRFLESESETPLVATYELPDDVDIPGFVAELRKSDGTGPRVSPNHVLTGSPRWCGWPGSDAEPADEIVVADGTSDCPDEGKAVRIVVIDTGLDKRASHHPLLQGVEVAPTHIDHSADTTPRDRYIDDQAGHAAFIAGVIRQEAPGASIRIIRALDTQGVTDEATVAAAILRAAEDARGADIINLSLGGYTDGDVPPISIVEALAKLSEGTVVVAAAGNLDSDRVTYPAAIDGVIAVGATDAKRQPASFTNFGDWVDCCTDGVDVHSVYVHGEENPELDMPPDTFTGHALWSGTSFSCPRVCAKIANEMQTNGGSARDAADRLLSGGAKMPGLGVFLP